MTKYLISAKVSVREKGINLVPSFSIEKTQTLEEISSKPERHLYLSTIVHVRDLSGLTIEALMEKDLDVKYWDVKVSTVH